MIDTTNLNMRRVKTPIGEGRLCDYDPNHEPTLYCVAIRKKETNKQMAGPFIFKWFTAKELSEVKA